MSTNDYRTLELNNSASISDVKKKYKDLAKKHHPDRGGESTKFKEISKAYDNIVNNKHSVNQFRPLHPVWNVSVPLIITLDELYYGCEKYIKVVGQTINIPRGLLPNTVMKIPDTNVTIHLKIHKHANFDIVNNDIHITKHVDICELLTGFTGFVPFFKDSKLYIKTPDNIPLKEGPYTIPGYGLQHHKLCVKFKLKYPLTFDENKTEALFYIFNKKKENTSDSYIKIT